MGYHVCMVDQLAARPADAQMWKPEASSYTPAPNRHIVETHVGNSGLPRHRLNRETFLNLVVSAQDRTTAKSGEFADVPKAENFHQTPPITIFESSVAPGEQIV